MLDFIPQLLVLVGLGGGVIILVRKAKYLPEEGLKASFETIERLKIFWRDRIVSRFPKEELEARLISAVEKTLRRGRIVAMKIDYLLLRALDRLRETRDGKELQANYWKEFAKPEVRFSLEDLLEAELRLKANPLFATHEEYQQLAEVYLAKNSFSDARRLLLEAWRRSPKDLAVIALLESVARKEV